MSALEDLNAPEFLAELQGGSIEPFNRLATETFEFLWRFLLLHGVPEPDAEEIVQDALMRVYCNVGTFRRNGQAKLTTWIFQICRNLAVDFHRVSRPVQQAVTEDNVPTHSDQQFAGRNAAYMSRLREALEQLATEDQEVLLWRSRDIAYAEIAGWLGVKEGTARVRHLRAEKKLIAALGPLDVPSDTDMQDLQESGAANA